MLNKKLNNIPQYANGAFLVKFLKEMYLEDLLAGNLYMNNFEFFIDLEKRTKIKGQGDKLEVGHVIRGTNIRLINSETNQVIAEGSVGEIVERYNGAEKIPVFCLTIFPYEEFEIIEEKENSVVAKLNIPIDDQKNYIQTFGDKAVILPSYFLDRVEERAEEDNLGLAYGKVEYLDYNVISSERRQLFDEKSLKLFFWKEDFFKNQREFRIVLSQKPVRNNFIMKLGNITEGAIVIDSENLFTCEFEFPIDKGE